MKTKHLLGALLSFLYTIIFFSCGNNDEKDIFFILRKRVLRTTLLEQPISPSQVEIGTTP